MASKHITQLEGFIKDKGTKVVEDFRYLCFKKFSLIYDYEIMDLFNDCYFKVARALTKKADDYEVDVAKYFYHSLRMKAIETNKARGQKNKKVQELMEWHDKQDEPNDEEEVDEFRIAVYKETMRFIEANFTKRKIDVFKFRVLSGMTWPEMAKTSGYTKQTLINDYNAVANAVHDHFKTNKLKDINLNETIRKSKVDTKPL